MKRKIIYFLLTIGTFSVCGQHADAQNAVQNGLVGNGAGESRNAVYVIVATVGQPAIGVMSGPVQVNSVGFTYTFPNSPPTVSPISDRTINDNGVAVTIPFTVSDPGGRVEDLVIVGKSDNPTLVPDANIVIDGSDVDRTASILPARDTGRAKITLTVDDGRDAVSVTFQLNVNDLPKLIANTGFTVTEQTTDNSISRNELSVNDSSPAHELIYTILTAPKRGNLKNNGTLLNTGDTFTQAHIDAGMIAYGHTASDETDDSFTFSFSDEHYTSTDHVFPITINDIPQLTINVNLILNVGDAASPITSANLSIADTDHVADQLIYTVVTTPERGDLKHNGIVLNVNNTFTQVDIDTGGITYDHTGEDENDDSFVFTVSDGLFTGENQTFTLIVNNAPKIVLTPRLLEYTENDDPLVIGSEATVTDPDTDDFDTGILTVEIFDGSQAADRLSIRNQGTDTGEIGTTDGTISFGGVPVASFSGSAEGSAPLVITFNADATIATVVALVQNITYENVSDQLSEAQRKIRLLLTDGDGGRSVAALLTIDATPVNDAPVLDNSGEMTLADIDEDDKANSGDRVGNIIASAGGDRIIDLDGTDTEGIVVIGIDDTNGIWEYRIDSNTGWTAFGTVSNSSAVLLSATARVRFVPDDNYNGSAGNITFRAWDGTTGGNGNTGIDVSMNGGKAAYSTATETATLNVRSINDTPTVPNLSVSTQANTPISIPLRGEDVEGDTLTLRVVDPPQNGSVRRSDATWTYRPNEDFTGTDRFTYQADDRQSTNNLSPPGTVTITVVSHTVVDPPDDNPPDDNPPDDNPPDDEPPVDNRQPVALSQTVTVNRGNATTIRLDGVDDDGATLTARITRLPSSGTLFQTASGITPTAQITSESMQVTDGLRRLIYVPAEDGTAMQDSFNFTVNDGSLDAVDATVTVNIIPPPVVLSLDLQVGLSREFTLADNVSHDVTLDGFEGERARITVTSEPVTVVLSVGESENIDTDADGAEDLTVSVDAIEVGVSASISLANYLPPPTPIPIVTEEDTNIVIILVQSNEDEDRLSTTISTLPRNGNLYQTDDRETPGVKISEDSPEVTDTLNRVIYVPPQDTFGNGHGNFGFTANNGIVDSSEVEVTVDVLAVNDEPTIDEIPDPASINEDADEQIIELSGITSGARNEEQDLTISAVSSNTDLIPDPTQTYVSRETTGSFTYKPKENAFGTATITVTVTDDEGAEKKTHFDVVVEPVNDAPTAENAEIDANLGADTPVTLLGADVDGDRITARITRLPEHGMLYQVEETQLRGAAIVVGNTEVIDSQRRIIYTPSNEVGETQESFGFRIDDGELESAEGVVTVSITPIANGSGQMVVRPTEVHSGDTVELAFVYTPDARMTGGRISIEMPPDWTFTAENVSAEIQPESGDGTALNPEVFDRTITVPFQVLEIDQRLHIHVLDVISQPTAAEDVRFIAKSQASATGALVELASGPVTVNVGNARDGSGIAEITDLPEIIASTSVAEIEITFTASGEMDGGRIRIDIPQTFSPPLASEADEPGYTTAHFGGTIHPLTIDGHVITISIPTLAAGQTITVVYRNATAPLFAEESEFIVKSQGGTTGSLNPIQRQPTPVTVTGVPSGTGEASISLDPVSAGSIEVDIPIIFTAHFALDGGSIEIDIPIGWSQPQVTQGRPGYVTARSDGQIEDLSVSDQTITIAVITLRPNQEIRVRYGSGGGASGAIAQPAAGNAVFNIRSASLDNPIPTDISSFPYVIVHAPIGSGVATIETTPETIVEGDNGIEVVIEYTSDGIMDGGSLIVEVPESWSEPQLTSGIAGFTTASSEAGMIGEPIINGRQVTVPIPELGPAQTIKIVYGDGGGLSGAVANAPGDWTFEMRSTSAPIAFGSSTLSNSPQVPVLPIQPTISNVRPSSGPVQGGTSLTISGDNLQSDLTVTIGDQESTEVVVVSPTEITALTPPGVPGVVDVMVILGNGQVDTLPNGFTYTAAEIVVSPESIDFGEVTVAEPASETVTVNNTGTADLRVTNITSDQENLLQISEVTFTVPPESDLHEITLTLTAVEAGAVSGKLTIVSNAATSPTEISIIANAKLPPPIVTQIMPTSGPTSGGTMLTITGENFIEGAVDETQVAIGETEATVVFVSETTIDAITQEGVAGDFPVFVKNPDGQSAPPASDLFTYIDYRITPSTLGQGAQDIPVVITGANFGQVDSVSFGEGSGIANSITSQGENELTVNVNIEPDAEVGLRQVTVHQDGFPSEIVSLLVTPKPVVEDISPLQGTQGDSPLTLSIMGENFDEPRSIDFGDSIKVIGEVAAVSPTELTLTIEIGATAPLGNHPVVITNGDFGVSSKFEGFTVTPGQLEAIISSVQPPEATNIDEGIGEGEEVTFTGGFNDLGDTRPHEFKWDFGDGNESDGEEVSHKYRDDRAEGYMVTLTVRDLDGTADTKQVEIFVKNVEPTVVIEEAIVEGEEVKFTINVEDPGNEPQTLRLDFDDETPEQPGRETTVGTKITVRHDYMRAGDYIVTATANDGDSDSVPAKFRIQLVFPGDTDSDGVVDVIDILPIGRYWGQTVLGRKTRGTGLSLQLVDAPPDPDDDYWEDLAPATYADANGNGTIGFEDVEVIKDNWGPPTGVAPAKTHPATNWPQTLAIYEKMLSLVGQMPTSKGMLELRKYLAAEISRLREHYVPAVTQLLPNYPNPFNPDTWIPYQLAEEGHVTIQIYAASGQLVRTLELGHKTVGYYRTTDRAVHWNGRNLMGENVASGIYFYTLEAGTFYTIRKMAIVK